jgi:hypothetical protein
MYLTQFQNNRLLRRDYPQLDPLAAGVESICEQMARRGHSLQISPSVVEQVWLWHPRPNRDGQSSRSASCRGLSGAEFLSPAWAAGLTRWLEMRRPPRQVAGSILVCGVLPILVSALGAIGLTREQEEICLWLYPSPYRPLKLADWRLLWARCPELRSELKYCHPTHTHSRPDAKMACI